MLGIKLAASIMMLGTGTSTAGAVVLLQEALSGGGTIISDSSLIPVGLAVAIVGGTIMATIRVVRWIDRVNARLEKLEREGLIPPEEP